ncbi:MAG: hypothetical protein AAGF83_20530 [Cyanobacteria bacterium P01_G01_bin.67]
MDVAFSNPQCASNILNISSEFYDLFGDRISAKCSLMLLKKAIAL